MKTAERVNPLCIACPGSPVHVHAQKPVSRSFYHLIYQSALKLNASSNFTQNLKAVCVELLCGFSIVKSNEL
jgi:hypothetical protein